MKKKNEFIASEIILQNLVKKKIAPVKVNDKTCTVQQDSAASISAFYTELVL